MLFGWFNSQIVMLAEAPSGEPSLVDGIYYISTAEQLKWFANYVNTKDTSANAKLENDITLQTGVLNDAGELNTGTFTAWTAMGTESKPYTGTFDGDGHSISGLYYNDYYVATSCYYKGLFGCISGAVIKNLTIKDSYFSASMYMGGIAGCAIENSVIENCTNYARVNSENEKYYTGGIVGDSRSSTITNCINYGKVSNTYRYCGGIAGGVDDSNCSITNCQNYGTVQTTGSYVGGIAGDSKGSITNCKNYGTIISSGTEYAGGVAGYLSLSPSDCSNEGDVNSSAKYTGGVVGYARQNLTNLSNSGKVTGGTQTGGVAGAAARTITNCTNTGDVNGGANDCVGGIVGYTGGNVSCCINSGNIQCTKGKIGGISGFVDSFALQSCSVKFCLNTGSVSAASNSTTRGSIVGAVENSYYFSYNDCYYNSENYTGKNNSFSGTGCSTQQITSGEIAWKLNGSSSSAETPVFYQNLDNGGTKDEVPVLDSTHGTVYYGYLNCDDTAKPCGSNTVLFTEKPEHEWVNGICKVCSKLFAPDQDETGVYQLKNIGELNWFANYVNNASITKNQSARAVLMADISLGDTFVHIGTAEAPYAGTFDGNGHTVTVEGNVTTQKAGGLFDYVSGAAIKNLTVAGKITTTAKFTGGVIGYLPNKEGMTNLENVISKVVITSSLSGDNTHGGIVALSDGPITYTNCGFLGSIIAESGKSCGGLNGWANQPATFNNCYMAGNIITSNNNTDSATFCRNGNANNVILNNCYYLTACGAVQGTQKSEEEFQNGTVTWFLNGRTSVAKTGNTLGWYQNLKNDQVKDDYPVPDSTHGIVYKKDAAYTNEVYDTVEWMETAPHRTQVNDGTPKIVSTTKGEDFTWSSNTKANSGYYYTSPDNITNKDDGSGAEREGGAPKNAGTYYALIYLNPHWEGSVHFPETYTYMEFTIVGDLPKGAGTKENPYQITSSNELIWLAAYVNDKEENQNACAVLENDIDMAGIEWSGMVNYAGTFDGAGYTIRNLNSDKKGEGAYGLVQVLQSDGVIKNLKFDTVNVFVQGANLSAVIAGVNNGKIIGCTVENAVVQCGNYTGLAGIAASNNNLVENCAVLNSTLTRRYGGSNSQSIGGIVESNNSSDSSDSTSGIVQNCYTYNVTFTSGKVTGGIVASGTAPTNSYFYTTSPTTSTVDGLTKSTDEFKNGDVAWLLNDSTSTPADGKTLAWYQNLDNGQKVDAYPVLDSTHGTVYEGNGDYSNSNKTLITKVDQLNTLITEAETTLNNAETYTTASIDNLRNQIEAAKLITEQSGEQAITEAYSNLQAAITALKSAKATITLSSNPANSGILTGGGRYAEGDEVQISAKAVTGYTFAGWYAGTDVSGTPTTTATAFTYTVKVGDTAIAYTAKYTANENKKLSVNIGSGAVDYSYNKTTGKWNNSITDNTFAKGTYFTVTANANENYTFLYWIDRNTNRILSENVAYSFYLSDDVQLDACYKNKVESEHYVIFKDMNGKILKSGDVTHGTAATAPNHGTFTGYTFTGWDKTFNTVTEDMVIKAVYERQTGITVTVTEGTGTILDAKDSYEYGTLVTLQAEEQQNNKYFSGWYIGDKLASDKMEYSFYVTENVTLTAKYEGEAVLKEQPMVTMNMGARSIVAETGYQTIQMNVTWSVPEGYTMLEAGLVRTLDDNQADNLELSKVDGTTIKQNKTKYLSANGTYAYTLTLGTASKSKNLYAKGYLSYVEDATGEIHTIYTDKYTSNTITE